jgi:3D (Asp-Asp-Asp) domain-containing protein
MNKLIKILLTTCFLAILFVQEVQASNENINTDIKSNVYKLKVNIPYSITVIETSDLEFGLEEITQIGVMGQKEIEFTTSFNADGYGEKLENILSEIVLSAPIEQIVLKGVALSIKTSSGDFSYVKELDMFAYAYSNGGTGASGIPMRRGLIAVDPSVIPLGTKLYVEGYGFAIAADTGGIIKGNVIDLYMDTVAECLKFGKKMLKVYILTDQTIEI